MALVQIVNIANRFALNQEHIALVFDEDYFLLAIGLASNAPRQSVHENAKVVAQIWGRVGSTPKLVSRAYEMNIDQHACLGTSFI